MKNLLLLIGFIYSVISPNLATETQERLKENWYLIEGYCNESSAWLSEELEESTRTSAGFLRLYFENSTESIDLSRVLLFQLQLIGTGVGIPITFTEMEFIDICAAVDTYRYKLSNDLKSVRDNIWLFTPEKRPKMREMFKAVSKQCDPLDKLSLLGDYCRRISDEELTVIHKEIMDAFYRPMKLRLKACSCKGCCHY